MAKEINEKFIQKVREFCEVEVITPESKTIVEGVEVITPETKEKILGACPSVETIMEEFFQSAVTSKAVLEILYPKGERLESLPISPVEFELIQSVECEGTDVYDMFDICGMLNNFTAYKERQNARDAKGDKPAVEAGIRNYTDSFTQLCGTDKPFMYNGEEYFINNFTVTISKKKEGPAEFTLQGKETA